MAERSVFFGYGKEPPLLADRIRQGIARISQTGLVDVHSWEDLPISGQLIIDVVKSAIDSSTIAAFDVTTCNSNVLFELGYAIGSNKPVWLLFDASDEYALQRWNKVRTLTTLGYSSHRSSEDVQAEFLKHFETLLSADTVFQRHIEGSLRPGAPASVFCFRSNHADDPASALLRRVRAEEGRTGAAPIVADNREAPTLPLTYYAQAIYASGATIVHLCHHRRHESDEHNARASLVAGLASGMGKPVLLLAEPDTITAIDYRDEVLVYGSTSELRDGVDKWLKGAVSTVELAATRQSRRQQQIDLSARLRGLFFGDPVAENEADTLPHYFVDTPHFAKIIKGETGLFVGRKGAGKTACLLAAREELAHHADNLVAVISPTGAEMSALLEFISTYDDAAQRHALDALWEFLLMTEVGAALRRHLERLSLLSGANAAQRDFIEFVDDADVSLDADFTVRLETALGRLQERISGQLSHEEFRGKLTQALHQVYLSELRRKIGSASPAKLNAYILIDNLDASWDSSTNVAEMSRVLLALLEASRKIRLSFAKSSSRLESVNVSVAVFLRTDILDAIKRVAGEVDKLPISELVWRDPNALAHIPEQRYLYADQSAETGTELWSRYFVDRVDGQATREYILSSVLPRPRDIVMFCRTALDAALSSQHERILAEDVIAAEGHYSEFALDRLLVEGRLEIPDLEELILCFLERDAVMTIDGVRDALTESGLDEDSHADAIEKLLRLEFLGVSQAGDRLMFPASERDVKKALVLVRRALETGQQVSLGVHPAYHSVLAISRPPMVTAP